MHVIIRPPDDRREMGETNESIIVALLHVLDTLLHFETRALQRRPWSKIEHKFRTFIRTVKYGET